MTADFSEKETFSVRAGVANSSQQVIAGDLKSLTTNVSTVMTNNVPCENLFEA